MEQIYILIGYFIVGFIVLYFFGDKIKRDGDVAFYISMLGREVDAFIVFAWPVVAVWYILVFIANRLMDTI